MICFLPSRRVVTSYIQPLKVYARHGTRVCRERLTINLYKITNLGRDTAPASAAAESKCHKLLFTNYLPVQGRHFPQRTALLGFSLFYNEVIIKFIEFFTLELSKRSKRLFHPHRNTSDGI